MDSDPVQKLVEIGRAFDPTTEEIRDLSGRVYEWSRVHCEFRADSTTALRDRETFPLILWADEGFTHVALIKHAFVVGDTKENVNIWITGIPVYDTDLGKFYDFEKHDLDEDFTEFQRELTNERFLGSLNDPNAQSTVNITRAKAAEIISSFRRTTKGDYGITTPVGSMVYIGSWTDDIGPLPVIGSDVLPNYDIVGVVHQQTGKGETSLAVRTLLRGGLPLTMPQDKIVNVPFWSHERILILSRSEDLDTLKKKTPKRWAGFLDSIQRLDTFFFKKAYTSISGKKPVEITAVQIKVSDPGVEIGGGRKRIAYLKVADELFLSADPRISTIDSSAAGSGVTENERAREVALGLSQKNYMYGYGNGKVNFAIVLSQEKTTLNTLRTTEASKIILHLLARNEYVSQIRGPREAPAPTPPPRPKPRPPVEPPVQPPVESPEETIQRLEREKQKALQEKDDVLEDIRSLRQANQILGQQNSALGGENQQLRNQVGQLRNQVGSLSADNQRLRQLLEEGGQRPPPVPAPAPAPVPAPVPDIREIARLVQLLEKEKATLRNLSAEALALRRARKDPAIVTEQEKRVQRKIRESEERAEQINTRLRKVKQSKRRPAPTTEKDDFLFSTLDEDAIAVLRLPWTTLVNRSEVREDATLRSQVIGEGLSASMDISFYADNDRMPYASLSSPSMDPVVVLVGASYSMSYGFLLDLLDNGRLQLNISTYREGEDIQYSKIAALANFPETGVVKIKFNGRNTVGKYTISGPGPIYLSINLFNNPEDEKEPIAFTMADQTIQRYTQTGVIVMEIIKRDDVDAHALTFIHVIRTIDLE